MSNSDQILSFLRSIAPSDATNAEIVARTGVRPHQQVFTITRDLVREGVIRGIQDGKEWRFRFTGTGPAPLTDSVPVDQSVELEAPRKLTPGEFEIRAQRAMSDHFRSDLRPRAVPGWPKKFDLVSDDHRIAGDAKLYTLVRGVGLPPAKFSIIAEHVWMLEKVGADRRFLVFGNDRRVPQRWLDRYRAFAALVEFYFLDDAGKVHHLT